MCRPPWSHVEYYIFGSIYPACGSPFYWYCYDHETVFQFINGFEAKGFDWFVLTFASEHINTFIFLIQSNTKVNGFHIETCNMYLLIRSQTKSMHILNATFDWWWLGQLAICLASMFRHRWLFLFPPVCDRECVSLFVCQISQRPTAGITSEQFSVLLTGIQRGWRLRGEDCGCGPLYTSF